MIELSIKISDESKSLLSKHLIYEENVNINRKDPTLSKLVQDSVKEFKGSPDDIVLKFRFVW